MLLVVALAIALLVDGAFGTTLRGTTDDPLLRAASPDRTAVTDVRSVLAGLPRRPLVLVGMDPDLGSYPEIRGTLRATLDVLAERDAGIALVSFTPEGRAIAAAETDRLRAGGLGPERLADLGFVAGAEAGLVLAVTDIVPADRREPLAASIRESGDGIAAFDLVVVVGGVDFGPRSWVEQVGTRLPALPIVAIAPTFTHPELAPYRRTGQLAAVLATTRDAAAWVAYVDGTAVDRTDPAPAAPAPLPMLVGMLAAIAVIGRALALGGAGNHDAGDQPEDEA